jgi:hypothetical protein
LEQVEKTTGKRPKEMESQEAPYNLMYLWECFWDINDGRQSGMSGPTALSWHEIRSWSDLSGIEIDPWELKAIRAMDKAFLSAVNKKGK